MHILKKTCVKFKKDWCKIIRGVAITRYPLSIHLRSGNNKVHKAEKSDKKYCKDYIKSTCTSSDYGEKMRKVLKKIDIKLYEELCSWGTHWLYIEGEKWLSSQWGKSNKNHHEENTCKISKRSIQNCKRSCAHKRYPLYIEGEKWLSPQLKKKKSDNDLTITFKPDHIAQLHTVKRHMHSFKTISAKLLRGDALTRGTCVWKMTRFTMWKKWQNMI